MRTRSVFYLLIYANALAFGHILQKMALNEGVDRYVLAFLRIAFGLVIFTIMAIPRKFQPLKVMKENFRHFIVLGVIYSGVGIILKLWGLSLTTATNASFIMSLSSVASVFFAFWLLKEKARKRFYLAVLAMTGGVYLVTTGGKQLLPQTGDLIILLVAVNIGYMEVYAKRVLKTVSVLDTAFGRSFIGTIFLGFVMLFLAPRGLATITNFHVWLLVLANGLTFSSSVLFFYMALRTEGASNTGVFALLVPLLTVVLGYFLLSEVLNGWQMAGGFIILAGSYFISRLTLKSQGGGNP